MSPRLSLTIAFTIAVSLGATSSALAQDDPRPSPDPRPGPRDADADNKAKAVKIFRAGIKRFDEGYYQEAISLYKKALSIFNSAKIHTRIGQAYIFLARPLKAIEHYEIFLKEFPAKPTEPKDQKLRSMAERTLQLQLKRVAQLKVEMTSPAGAEVRVNGRKIGIAPLSKLIRLLPGEANVSAALKGYYGFRRDISLPKGKVSKIEITLIKIKPKVVSRVIRIKATPIYKRWWFWTTIGVLVAGGTATGLGVGLSRTRRRDLTGVVLNHDGLLQRQ